MYEKKDHQYACIFQKVIISIKFLLDSELLTTTLLNFKIFMILTKPVFFRNKLKIVLIEFMIDFYIAPYVIQYPPNICSGLLAF